MRTSRDNTAGNDMRQRIKKVATELLIRKGFRGASYGDIATALGTTTTNIHYHFGPKKKLVEEVVQDYVRNALTRQSKIWLNPDTSLSEKLSGVLAFNAERYRKFNRGSVSGRPWSLIGRLRLESDLLSPPAREALTEFSTQVQDYVLTAVCTARDKGELKAGSPVDDIAFLLTSIVNTSSTFTQEAGSIERLADYFHTVSRVVEAAYASPNKLAPGNTERHRTGKLLSGV
ncbi:TetR/AcrR family transcriptional regulator [Leptospira interrogans]